MMVLCILISDGKSLTIFEFLGYDFFSGQVLNLFPVVFSVRSSIYLIKFLEGSIFRTFRFGPTLDLLSCSTSLILRLDHSKSPLSLPEDGYFHQKSQMVNGCTLLFGLKQQMKCLFRYTTFMNVKFFFVIFIWQKKFFSGF